MQQDYKATIQYYKTGKPYTTLGKTRKERSETDARKRYLAIIFILNANKNKFTKYRVDCSNNFQAYNQNLCPKTLEAVHEALGKFKYDVLAYIVLTHQSHE